MPDKVRNRVLLPGIFLLLTGLFGVLVDGVLLFNILHCEQPVVLLRHAKNALGRGGEVLVIRTDPETPLSQEDYPLGKLIALSDPNASGVN